MAVVGVFIWRGRALHFLINALELRHHLQPFHLGVLPPAGLVLILTTPVRIGRCVGLLQQWRVWLCRLKRNRGQRTILSNIRINYSLTPIFGMWIRKR